MSSSTALIRVEHKDEFELYLENVNRSKSRLDANMIVLLLTVILGAGAVWWWYQQAAPVKQTPTSSKSTAATTVANKNDALKTSDLKPVTAQPNTVRPTDDGLFQPKLDKNFEQLKAR
jgi:cytoskeletal protein RodZ